MTMMWCCPNCTTYSLNHRKFYTTVDDRGMTQEVVRCKSCGEECHQEDWYCDESGPIAELEKEVEETRELLHQLECRLTDLRDDYDSRWYREFYPNERAVHIWVDEEEE